jgi:formylglycine-generating enzyme required for sulfatase activity
VVAATAGALVLARGQHEPDARCGPGFSAVRARCRVPEGACPAPLVTGPRGCDAPSTRVAIPAATLAIGPSDWEAEGRVAARTIRTAPFAIDAFEATVAAVTCAECPLPDAAVFAAAMRDHDGARAMTGLSRQDAAKVCAARGGRLPTDDEWTVAAAFDPRTGDTARRYPWGEAGAVCGRGAWGLAAGPCARGGDGPDTVGAHPDGKTPSGLYDVAGNAAEWVSDMNAVRGGSWRSAFVAELRTWARQSKERGAADSDAGVRCVYAPSARE